MTRRKDNKVLNHTMGYYTIMKFKGPVYASIWASQVAQWDTTEHACTFSAWMNLRNITLKNKKQVAEEYLG